MSKKANRRRNLRRWALERFGPHCQECGEPLDQETLTLDHYPVRKRDGGTYCRDNVRPLCEPCNTADAFCINYRVGA